MIFTTTNFTILAIKLTQVKVTLDKLPEFCNASAIYLGATTAMVRMVVNWIYRDETSVLFEQLNDKTKVAKNNKLLGEYSKYYLLNSWIVVAGIMGTCFTSSIFLTSPPYFNVDNSTPQDLTDYLQIVGLALSLLYTGIFYSILDGQMLDCACQLAFLVKVQCGKLAISGQSVVKDEEIISVYKELVQLKKLTSDYLQIIWRYQFYVWSICFLGLGLSAVCLSFIQNDALAFAKLIIFPCYVLEAMGIWCFIGNYYEVAVSGRKEREREQDDG